MLSSNSAYAELSSLCNTGETTVWSCLAKNKIYSLCKSNDLDAENGYLQYRVASSKKIIFQYPKEVRHPKGYFEFYLQPHGASLSFTNEGYEYLLTEDIKGGAIINVQKNAESISNIICMRIKS